MRGPDYHGEPCECNGGPACACPDCDHTDCSYRHSASSTTHQLKRDQLPPELPESAE